MVMDVEGIRKTLNRSVKSSVGIYLRRALKEQAGAKQDISRFEGMSFNGRRVQSLYSQKSRVMRSTPEMRAVKLSDGSKGWISAEGRFIGLDDTRNILHSIDSTSSAAIFGVSLLDIFDSLTPLQQARFATRIRNYNWDQFWEDYYPPDGQNGEYDVDLQMDLYSGILEALGDLAGWS